MREQPDGGHPERAVRERATHLPDALRDSLRVVAFPLRVLPCRDDSPERVPEEPDGNDAERDLAEGPVADHRQRAARIRGGAAAVTERGPQRQHADHDVHDPLGRVPQACQHLDPRRARPRGAQGEGLRLLRHPDLGHDPLPWVTRGAI